MRIDLGMRPILLLPLLAMVIDVAMTLAWRMGRRQRWWDAHVDHAYQRWSRRSGHPRVTIAYGVWTLLASGFMLVWLRTSLGQGVVVALAWSATSMAVWWWLHRPRGGRTEGFGA